MSRGLIRLLALTTMLFAAPASASIMLSAGSSAQQPRCPQERAKAAAQARSPAQKPKAATTITLMDRLMEGSSLLHFGSRGVFAP